MILRDTWNPCLVCDRCGLAWREGSGAAGLRGNASAAGWQERRLYAERQDYCPGCVGIADARERVNRWPRRK